MLAGEWLDEVDAPLDVRYYLVETLLPTLVMGLEKLLREASQKNVLDEDVTSPTAFNPINYLAQYLMRNNPRFSNFSEASRYNRSMRLVQQELKERAYELTTNRAAKIAAEVERRRLAVEAEEKRKHESWTQHLEPILQRYPEWDDTGAGLNSATLITALRSFHAFLRKTDAELELNEQQKAALNFADLPQIQANPELPVTLDAFTRQLGPILESVPSNAIELLAMHLNKVYNQEQFATLAFQNLFDGLEVPPNRRRFMAVLQEYYDQTSDSSSAGLLRPRAFSFADRFVIIACLY